MKVLAFEAGRKNRIRVNTISAGIGTEVLLFVIQLENIVENSSLH